MRNYCVYIVPLQHQPLSYWGGYLNFSAHFMKNMGIMWTE